MEFVAALAAKCKHEWLGARRIDELNVGMNLNISGTRFHESVNTCGLRETFPLFHVPDGCKKVGN